MNISGPGRTAGGCVAALAGLWLLAGGCRFLPHRPPPAGIVARVNGQPIPASALDRLYADQGAAAEAHLSPEQALRLRLTLLDQLIDRSILLQYAAREGIVADPTQIAHEMEIERARDPNRPEAELRQQVSETLVLQALMQQEVGSKVQVSDDEITAFYQQNQGSFQLPERQYHVLEIVVTTQAAAVTNLAGDKAASLADARRKIRMLQDKLKQGADFSALAEQYSEDPNTASSGGDLGLLPESALSTDMNPALRDAILALHPGQVSPVISSGDGLYLLKLVGIEAPGARKLTDPEVRQSIRELLASGREQLLQTAFLSTVRDQAKVENYLAEQVLRDQGVGTAGGEADATPH